MGILTKRGKNRLVGLNDPVLVNEYKFSRMKCMSVKFVIKVFDATIKKYYFVDRKYGFLTQSLTI